MSEYLHGFKQFTESNQQVKPWRGKAEDVVAKWKSLPVTPLQCEPLPNSYKGRRYSADGIRITGRGDFISAALSRLKDLIYNVPPNAKLDVEYKELSGKSNKVGALKKEPRYVASINVVEEKPPKPSTPQEI